MTKSKLIQLGDSRMAVKTMFKKYHNMPQKLSNTPFYGMQLDNYQKEFIDAIWADDVKIVFCNASAGTGKTHLSVAVAYLLYEYKNYDGIIYAVAPYGMERQGFLPGDITKKSEVYFEPLYQALVACGLNPFQVINNEPLVVDKKDDNAFLKCVTHTYFRGINFDNQVVIIDEAQNYDFESLKKTITRCKDNCKVIIIGHDGQIDLKYQQDSGFIRYLNHFKSQDYCRVCELKYNYRGLISNWADKLCSNGMVLPCEQEQ